MSRIASPLLEEHQVKTHAQLFKSAALNSSLHFQEIIDASIKDSMITMDTAIQSAGFIFAHTILDECLKTLCYITSQKFKDRWNDVIYNKSMEITGSNLLKCSREELRDKFIAKELKVILKGSIPDRVEFLLARCKPVKNWEFSSEYTFDMVELKKFDKLRHKIIHGKRLSKIISIDFAQMITFIIIQDFIL